MKEKKKACFRDKYLGITSLQELCFSSSGRLYGSSASLSSGQCAHTPETGQSVQGMVQGQPPALSSRITGLTTHPTIADFHGGYKELCYSRHTDQQEKNPPCGGLRKGGLFVRP